MTQELPERVKHNMELAQEFVATRKVSSRYPRVSEQVELVPINTSSLFEYGYNPSIIEFGGKLLMTYRYHTGTLWTRLAMADWTEDGQVTNNHALEVNGYSVEDPKFFTLGNILHMSWVESHYPMELEASVRYGNFANVVLKEIGRPSYGHNEGFAGKMEKNWVFFERNDLAYFIYESDPKQIVVHWSGIKEDEYVTDGPSWAYGKIKGGTMPVPFGSKLLRFFHSTLDNDPGQWRRRYYIGACVMEPEPPFKTIRTSTKPIIYGSEVDGLKPAERKNIIHYKGNVVFPGGIVMRDGYWLLSLGVNDAACAVAKITEKELNL